MMSMGYCLFMQFLCDPVCRTRACFKTSQASGAVYFYHIGM